MPRSRSAASPPGVVGPLAASTTNLHCSRFALSSARMFTVRQRECGSVTVFRRSVKVFCRHAVAAVTSHL